jgi:hypothetical protein
LIKNGTIAGQKGWFMSEIDDVQVNGEKACAAGNVHFIEIVIR